MQFDPKTIERMWKPGSETTKFSMGQVTIIGGSDLFHGAPILALKAASRLVGMVYCCMPKTQKEVLDQVKGAIGSFIMVDKSEVGEYIKKSDVVLIGPGMMRNRYEKDGFACDEAGRETSKLSKKLLADYPEKRWVIDGGSLQVLHKEDLPKGCVITPNRKEIELLFHEKFDNEGDDLVLRLEEIAKKHEVTILYKGEVSVATDGKKTLTIAGGDFGLVKGATGDIIAGFATGFMAHNDPVESLAAASYLVKKASERLAKKYGQMYCGDDLVEEARLVYGEIVAWAKGW